MGRYLLGLFLLSSLIGFSAEKDTRSDSIDIINYLIKLDITDFTGKTIKGSTVVTYKPKVAGLNYIHLDLLKMKVDSVKINNQKLTYSYNDTLLRIGTPTLSLGSSASLEVFYAGAPKKDASWGGFYFSGNFAFNLGVGFSSDPHNLGRVWFPCFDNFTERSTYEFFITTTANKKAVCNGELIDQVTNANTTITWHWKMDTMIPTYLACVAVGPYVFVKDYYVRPNNDTLPIMIAAQPADTVKMKNSFSNLKKAIECYEKSYGPYRWSRVGYSLVPFSAGAMEHATNIAYPAAFCDGSKTYETVMAHELSHHWWGDLITCETSGDMWINEGMATYSEHLFTEFVYGRAAAIRDIKANQKDVVHMAHINEDGYRPLYGIPHDYTYGEHVYNKGGFVGHNLREYLGDSLYSETVKALMDYYSHQTVNSYTMRDYMSTYSGKDLTSFFNDWVFNGGFSHFSIDSTKFTANGSKYDAKVYIKQKQRGTSNVHTNVPLRISFFDSNWNKYNVKVMVSGQTTAINVQVPFMPVYTTLNFDHHLNTAATTDIKVVKAVGATSMSNANFSLTVSAVTDSSLIRVDQNWVTPDNPVVNGKYRLSPNRYWTVSGIFSSGFKASGKINYDGRTNAGFLDYELGNFVEDSLVLLYRTGAGDTWKEFPYYKKLMGGLTDKVGSVTIDSLFQGEYVFAIKDYTASSTGLIQPKAKINLFPNPASELVFFSNISLNSALDITIYDIHGRSIRSENIDKGRNEISIAGLINGLYFIEFKSNNEIVGKEKLLIQR